MPPKTDRRVRRTRNLLHRALMDLILEKGYARITVQDILDRADVGRSTFYAHYRTKDDLLLVSGTEHLRAMLAEDTPPTSTDDSAHLLHPALTMFRLADRNRALSWH